METTAAPLVTAPALALATAVKSTPAPAATRTPEMAVVSPVSAPTWTGPAPTETATTGSAAEVVSTPPPPTPSVESPALPEPSPTPNSVATPTAPGTATPQSLSADWQLVSYSLGPDPGQNNALLIYGELQNTSSTAQEITALNGAVLNAQGQSLAAGSALISYTPVTALAPGDRTPFEISVAGLTSAAGLNLSVASQATTELWRSDFTVSELSPSRAGDSYCVTGRIANPGAGLQEALIIAVKLYDADERLINFSDFTPNSPGLVVGDQTLLFTVCVNPPNQNVARYAVQAWGR